MFVLFADMNITYLPCGNVLLFYPPSPYQDGKPSSRALDRLSNLPQKSADRSLRQRKIAMVWVSNPHAIESGVVQAGTAPFFV